MPPIEPSIPLVYPSRANLPVETSRALTALDDGRVLQCTPGITLSVPDGLPAGFAVNILIPDAAGGTVTLSRTGTATINGSGSNLSLTLTRPAMWTLLRNVAADSFTALV